MFYLGDLFGAVWKSWTPGRLRPSGLAGHIVGGEGWACMFAEGGVEVTRISGGVDGDEVTISKAAHG